MHKICVKREFENSVKNLVLCELLQIKLSFYLGDVVVGGRLSFLLTFLQYR